MSDVLRSTTFQLAFNGADGLTGIRTFTKAVSDADKTVNELNAKLGTNATVTYKSVRSKKELTADARALVTQMERNQKVTERITNHYKLLADTVGKTAEEIEVLNAVSALGSNATEAQRQAVTNSVREYQQLRGSIEQAQGSMRNMRGVAQNFGWQMQDTVVQLQMGTSAFVVLSQQGSQMASAFGPTGAIIGAIIALAGAAGGVLYAALNDTAGALDRLNEITQRYSEYVSISANGTTELSAKLEELARYSKLAADSQLQLARIDVFKSQTESVKVLKKALKDEIDFRAFYGDEEKLGLSRNRELVSIIASVRDLEKRVNQFNLDKYLKAISRINPEAKGASEGAAALKQTLLDQYVTLQRGITLLDDTSNGWKDLSKPVIDATTKITQAFQSELNSLVRQTETIGQEYARRKASIDDYVKQVGKADDDASRAYALLEEWKTTELNKQAEKRRKIQEDATKKIINAFNSEFLTLTKQTETIDQEYARRKAIVDQYVTQLGQTDERAKSAYQALDQWKQQQERKEFDRLVSGLIKRTNTVDEEYERQKAIIDAHVKRVGSVDSEAAQAYIALEKWKTEQVQDEYNKRESVRRRIENAQIRVKCGAGDGTGAETELYTRNMTELRDQLAQLGQSQLTERERIHALIEAEVTRHNTVMSQLGLQQVSNQIAVFAMGAQQLTALADLMSNGIGDIKNKVREMNDVQKAMFIFSQMVAAAQAWIAGLSLGSQLATLFPLAAPQMIILGNAIGAAQAGAIAGVTLAGAFDKGGDVPAGEFGIVSEYGDELVNGMLVKGPARVTSREETKRLMNGGTGNTAVSLKVEIANNIPNANYQVEQLDENRVRIIAEQVFSKNIDDGVSASLSNRNSKASKSMRRNYKVASNL